MKRTTAIRKLANVLDRVDHWNTHHALWIKIETVILVGSVARNVDAVGDIDLCFGVECIQSYSDHLEEYMDWRHRALGYRPPRSHIDVCAALSANDAYRYLKNKDGRIEAMTCNQLDFIKMSMDPFITLVYNGKRSDVDLHNIPALAKPISKKNALKLIDDDILSAPSSRDDKYWEDYCEQLYTHKKKWVRKRILARDNTTVDYKKWVSDLKLKQAH